jgi:hypothetical protein
MKTLCIRSTRKHLDLKRSAIEEQSIRIWTIAIASSAIQISPTLFTSATAPCVTLSHLTGAIDTIVSNDKFNTFGLFKGTFDGDD